VVTLTVKTPARVFKNCVKAVDALPLEPKTKECMLSTPHRARGALPVPAAERLLPVWVDGRQPQVERLAPGVTRSGLSAQGAQLVVLGLDAADRPRD
jgi:hypothetical protein